MVFRHVPHESLGTLTSLLKERGLRPRFADAFRPPVPWPPPTRISGLIVLGGPMGVYERDRYPFLAKESAYIQKAAHLGTPVLGICLGAQLIAHALGARVYPNPRKEIGWFRVRPTAAGRQDPLFHGARAAPWVFQWHGDTFDLPRGARLLATSRLCRHQAFRWGDRVLAVQFHPEIDRELIQTWLSQPDVDRELAAVPTTRARVLADTARHLRNWGRSNL